ncbi:hypothetical protein A6P39_044255 (plasmid) [Streptomyces sp. FXJ1.172]|uniref:hypothetical protein n=1 Tax=Streptomyces sp. FXJ1.172 TaxID=710705 RepID=UPI0023DCFE32|nr:hypothetical protein [Streptomyces sp. FXJ1.172]WEP00722.1 hypothetical protein A6P39_044255 [Streptomyces sp. FXJ1.172]
MEEAAAGLGLVRPGQRDGCQARRRPLPRGRRRRGQDFSANQVRAVLNHVTDEHTLTFVLDAAQRIYPQRFTWAEVGLSVGPHNNKLLSKNFRNTRQIAAFAALCCATWKPRTTLRSLISPRVRRMATSPCSSRAPSPSRWTTSCSSSTSPENDESVAILHAKGGGWFDYVKTRLNAAGLAWVELTRNGNGPPAR